MEVSPRSNRLRRTIARWCTVAAAGTALLAGGLVGAGPAHADRHEDPGTGDGQQFVWPMSSWIAATDNYANDEPHSGSADLANQISTPIYPAREGTVIHSGYANGSWSVRIEHENSEGPNYVTHYGHLVEKPRVEEEAEVDLDTPIGYNGRTGNANMSGAHIHFAIYVEDTDGPLMRIPDTEIGDWADVEDYIPGDYEGLDPIDEVPERTFDVTVVDESLWVYETTGRTEDERLTELSEGDEVTVLESDEGQYLVEADGETGWIAHSGTEPVNSTTFGVEITASGGANVRREPSEDGEVIGVLSSAGDSPGYPFFTGYERGGTNDDWVRVLWPCSAETNRSDDDADNSEPLGGCPSRGADDPPYFKYGWMGPAVT